MHVGSYIVFFFFLVGVMEDIWQTVNQKWRLKVGLKVLGF